MFLIFLNKVSTGHNSIIRVELFIVWFLHVGILFSEWFSTLIHGFDNFPDLLLHRLLSNVILLWNVRLILDLRIRFEFIVEVIMVKLVTQVFLILNSCRKIIVRMNYAFFSLFLLSSLMYIALPVGYLTNVHRFTQLQLTVFIEIFVDVALSFVSVSCRKISILI